MILVAKAAKMTDFLIRSAGPAFFFGIQYSTLQTAWMISARGSTGSIPLLPFSSLVSNCLVWTYYGSLLKDQTILIPNFAGLFVGAYCVYIFNQHNKAGNKVVERNTHIACGSIIVISTILYFLQKSELLGSLGVIMAIFLMYSPLSTLNQVLKTKSTESLVFSTSAVMFMSSLSWMIYGLYVKDNMVIIPNAAGFVLCCIQMGLFVMFGFPKSTSRTSSRQSLSASVGGSSDLDLKI